MIRPCLVKPQRDAVLAARFPRAGYRTFTVNPHAFGCCTAHFYTKQKIGKKRVFSSFFPIPFVQNFNTFPGRIRQSYFANIIIMSLLRAINLVIASGARGACWSLARS